MSGSDFNRANTKLINAMFFAPKFAGSRIQEGGVQIRYTHCTETHELHGHESGYLDMVARLSTCTSLGVIMSWGQAHLHNIVVPNSRFPQLSHLSYSHYEGQTFVSSEYITPNGCKVRVRQTKDGMEMKFARMDMEFTLAIRKQELELGFQSSEGTGKYQMKIYESHFAGFLDAIRAGDRGNFDAMLAKAVTINSETHNAEPYEMGKAFRRYMADEVPQRFGARLFELAHEASGQFTGCERALSASKY